MSLVAFIKAQLTDPSSGLHLLGFVIIAGEVIQHWVTHKPVDPGTIGAGVGCFAIGGTIDRFQDKPAA